jgi:hypothetical protein
MKRITERKIYFDMDGTIANLYGQENWLYDLRHEIVTPYEKAEALYDMVKLNALLEALKAFNFSIGVITWGSMDASDEYNKAVRKAKKVWITDNLPACSEFHFQKYGVPKHKATYQNIKINKDILIDDNAEVRKMWIEKGGIAINPTENLFAELAKLIA